MALRLIILLVLLATFPNSYAAVVPGTFGVVDTETGWESAVGTTAAEVFNLQSNGFQPASRDWYISVFTPFLISSNAGFTYPAVSPDYFKIYEIGGPLLSPGPYPSELTSLYTPAATDTVYGRPDGIWFREDGVTFLHGFGFGIQTVGGSLTEVFGSSVPTWLSIAVDHSTTPISSIAHQITTSTSDVPLWMVRNISAVPLPPAIIFIVPPLAFFLSCARRNPRN